MTYDLAKQLKDAGFPQTKTDGTLKNGHYIAEGREPCFDPTLSELIEACGDDFYSLVYALDDDWRCYSERHLANYLAYPKKLVKVQAQRKPSPNSGSPFIRINFSRNQEDKSIPSTSQVHRHFWCPHK